MEVGWTTGSSTELGISTH